MEKHRDMEGEGKGDGHQHGRKPRIPEPVPIAGKLTSPSEEEMGHWAPTVDDAHGASNGWLDGWISNRSLRIFLSSEM